MADAKPHTQYALKTPNKIIVKKSKHVYFVYIVENQRPRKNLKRSKRTRIKMKGDYFHQKL